MKKVLLAGTALMVVMNAGVAHSADMSAPVYTKAAPILAPNWTGFYIGLNVGAASSNGDLNAVSRTAPPFPFESRFSDSIHKTGLLGGGQIGYNWQAGQAVYGLEADAAWMDLKSASETFVDPFFFGKSNGAKFSSQIDWLATVRGRVGIAATPALLLYATGGLAIAGVKVRYENTGSGNLPATGPFSSSSTQLGWTAGFGAEYMIGGNWSVKAEYLHVALDKATLEVPPNVIFGNTVSGTVKATQDLDLIRLGLNLKL